MIESALSLGVVQTHLGSRPVLAEGRSWFRLAFGLSGCVLQQRRYPLYTNLLFFGFHRAGSSFSANPDCFEIEILIPILVPILILMNHYSALTLFFLWKSIAFEIGNLKLIVTDEENMESVVFKGKKRSFFVSH